MASSPQNGDYQKWLLILQVGSAISKHIYIVVQVVIYV